ncbi:hypothetical protein RhiirB3_387714 [Rhizophagus irregularis]|nr:hypothetical protein RhiirB3_387714 [Rhizophagus irregularis]
MEWEKINAEAFSNFRKENGLKEWEETRKLALEPNNFFQLGHKIISLAEKSKIFEEYTTLNDNFKQRLENENRYQDEKHTGEKRPILESPMKEKEEEDSDEDPYIPEECWIIDQQTERHQPLQFTMSSEAAEEEQKEPNASPSKKKSGTKKKKRGNKKK